MNRESTASRLRQLMSERNLKQVDILNMSLPLCAKYNVKMNKSDISQYVAGKVEPSQEKLVILGMALNVTESWLMGFDVPMERKDFHGSEKESSLTFGDKIRAARKSKHLTQKELADIIGVKFNSISDWESDKSRPDINIIDSLCETLGVTPAHLMGWDQPPASDAKLIANIAGDTILKDYISKICAMNELDRGKIYSYIDYIFLSSQKTGD